MCLFLTIEPTGSRANRTLVKRVLKGGSELSAYPANEVDRQLFYISNEPNCACDLHMAGPNALGAGIELHRSACESLEKIADALASAGVTHFEFRAFWGEQTGSEVCELGLSEFTSLVRANSFDGGVRYVVNVK